MAAYANRTCYKCGIRKPQPQMFQREIYVEVGKSQTGISGATMVGVLVGDKKSGSQFRNWMFNSGQRTYKRKKQAWMCGDCAGVQQTVARISVDSVKNLDEKPLAAQQSVMKVAADATKTPDEKPLAAQQRQTIVGSQGKEMSSAAKWFWAVILLSFVATLHENSQKKSTEIQPTVTKIQTSP